MGKLIGRWNYYFLRYGAGTIIGAIIVGLFIRHLGNVCPFFDISFFQNDEGHFELNGSAVTLLLVLGFAYCYIASAPGTVFHAARGLFWGNNPPKMSPQMKFWLLVLFSGIIALITIVAGLIVIECFCFHCGWRLFLIAIPFFLCLTI